MTRSRTHIAAGAALALLLAGLGAVPGAWGEAAKGSSKAPAAGTCNRAAFQLVVDVGHTLNGGALSARGVPEYDFNLRQASEIVEALREAGFAKIELLITTDPKRRALFKRADHANKMRADLFLSIHHDSVPDKFLERWEFEGTEHGFSDRFKGHSIFISNDNPERKRSLQFGHLLGLAMKARGLAYTPHYTEAFMGNRRRVLVDVAAGVYRYDQLIVLRSTRVPAVLLEAGSIINRDEELELGKPERRALITAAAVEAVTGFCAQKAGPAVAATAAKRNAKAAPPTRDVKASPKRDAKATTKR